MAPNKSPRTARARKTTVTNVSRARPSEFKRSSAVVISSVIWSASRRWICSRIDRTNLNGSPCVRTTTSRRPGLPKYLGVCRREIFNDTENGTELNVRLRQFASSTCHRPQLSAPSGTNEIGTFAACKGTATAQPANAVLASHIRRRKKGSRLWHGSTGHEVKTGSVCFQEGERVETRGLGGILITSTELCPSRSSGQWRFARNPRTKAITDSLHSFYTPLTSWGRLS